MNNPSLREFADCKVELQTATPQGAPASARAAMQLLQRLQHGSLTLQWPDGSMRRYGGDASPHATLVLHNWKVFSAAFKSGDIGFAESYIAGDWSTPNLTDLLRVLVKNREAMEGMIYGSWPGRMLYRVRHWLNRNTPKNSRKNIHAHYDLGNAFYKLWLDPTMNYSSALFNGDFSLSTETAQHAKVRRVLEQARVQPGHRVLEIGCGWGALAEKGTVEFGAHVTGVTLSTEQLEFANQRMQQRGTDAQADLRLQDYRDISDAPFDAICSVEMLEAVGEEFWNTYFQRIQELLKPGGYACIQSIVIDDALFERYRKSSDFIQQYIFPGGCLPCPRALRECARAAGLELHCEHRFGHDYAETLRRWRDAFLMQREAVQELGFDERFQRIWEFYLAYCEAAFDEESIDVVQYTLRKPL